MSDQKEKDIFQAALEVFAAQGFDRATMDEIAIKAGVAKGTLFYRYKSKDDLFLNLIRGAIDLFLSTVRSATLDLESSSARLAKAIEIQTELSYIHPEFTKLLLSEVWGKHERQRLFRVNLETYLNFLQSIIDEGIANNELRSTDSALLAASIFGMTAAASLHLMLSQDDLHLEDTVQELQHYLLDGI